MEETNKREWVEFISKLIDRELQRRSISGITLWAFLGFIVLVFNRIMNVLPELFVRNDLLIMSVLYTTLIFNYLVIFASTVHTIFVRHLDIEIKNNNYGFQKLISIPRDYAISLVLVFGSVTNILTAIYAQTHGLLCWPYYVIGGHFTINIFVDILQGSFQGIRKIFIRFVKDLTANRRSRRSFSNTTFFVNSVIFLILIYATRSIIYKWNVIADFQIIEFSLYIIGILISSFVFCLIYESYIRTKWLERLEIAIMTEEIQVNQVKEIISKEYT